MNKQVALITGTSSGFGLLSTIELAKAGVHVVATMRDIAKKDILLKEAHKHDVAKNIDIVQLDVTNEEDIERVKDYVLSTYSSVDILVNNAGYAAGGIAENLSMDDFKHQFETNVFGSIAVTKAFIPSMRNNRKGTIINIGSISGSIGFPGLTPYASSKFALRGFSEALRLELLPLNVYVCLIEPGSYQTSIWEKALQKVNVDVHDDYQNMMKMAYQSSINNRDNSANPAEVAQLVKKISLTEKPAFYHPIGKGIKTVIFLKKLLPWRLLERFLLKKM